MLTPEREAMIRHWQKTRIPAGEAVITNPETVHRDIDDLLAELDWTRIMLKDALEEHGLGVLEELQKLRQENQSLNRTIHYLALQELQDYAPEPIQALADLP